MTKSRLEAFSDGVLAIALTIMVLELHWPKEPTWEALRAILPGLGAYLLSFVFVGIYWVNHHHTFQVVHKVNGAALWANLHLLFWLSLVPLATGWLAATQRADWPVFFYGVVLLGAATAYTILIRVLVALEGPDSVLAQAVGDDRKGKVSLALYGVGLGLAFVAPWLAHLCYVAVACLWLVPDSRIERRVAPLWREGQED